MGMRQIRILSLIGLFALVCVFTGVDSTKTAKEAAVEYIDRVKLIRTKLQSQKTSQKEEKPAHDHELDDKREGEFPGARRKKRQVSDGDPAPSDTEAEAPKTETKASNPENPNFHLAQFLRYDGISKGNLVSMFTSHADEIDALDKIFKQIEPQLDQLCKLDEFFEEGKSCQPCFQEVQGNKTTYYQFSKELVASFKKHDNSELVQLYGIPSFAYYECWRKAEVSDDLVLDAGTNLVASLSLITAMIAFYFQTM